MIEYNFDCKEVVISELLKLNDFSGCEKIKEFIRLYQVVEDEKKKNLLKLNLYKLSGQLDVRHIREFDCDSCEDVTEVYNKAYKWLNDYNIEKQRNKTVKYELVKDDVYYRGDTMTSPLTPLKRYFVLQGFDEKTIRKNFDDFVLDNISNINISENASNFICNTHSIGNFFPVLQGFNTGRSNFGKWDSWDLVMKQIYLWFQDNPNISVQTNNTALTKLLSNSKNVGDAVNHCVQWLKNFSDWNDFVNGNHLNSYVDSKGKPISFFKNHSLENPLPNTLEEMEEFFKNANNCILKRGIEIDKKLNSDSEIINDTKISYKDDLIQKVKNLRIKNIDSIIMTLTKWIPILYAVVLFVLYYITKDKENSIFAYGMKPVNIFSKTIFINIILFSLGVALMISYKRALENKNWKYKKLLKFIMYIGSFGLTFSLLTITLYDANVIVPLINRLPNIFGYSMAVLIFNILTGLFYLVTLISVVCFIVSIIFSLILEESRETLFRVLYRVLELILIAFILNFAVLFFDNWKLFIVIGIAIIIFFILPALFSSGEDGLLKLIDSKGNILAVFKKHD